MAGLQLQPRDNGFSVSPEDQLGKNSNGLFYGIKDVLVPPKDQAGKNRLTCSSSTASLRSRLQPSEPSGGTVDPRRQLACGSWSLNNDSRPRLTKVMKLAKNPRASLHSLQDKNIRESNICALTPTCNWSQSRQTGYRQASTLLTKSQDHQRPLLR
jgi:hypothetical protein